MPDLRKFVPEAEGDDAEGHMPRLTRGFVPVGEESPEPPIAGPMVPTDVTDLG
ncbi:MAG TPA: hypothetical protein VIY72_11075 [Acidimicrobiales bacterium]